MNLKINRKYSLLLNDDDDDDDDINNNINNAIKIFVLCILGPTSSVSDMMLEMKI